MQVCTFNLVILLHIHEILLHFVFNILFPLLQGGDQGLLQFS